MDKAIKLFKSRKFFTAWFGFGIPPFLFGTVYLGYLISLTWGLITTAIIGFWVYQNFSTTCRRCQYYGTTKCGLPGMIVPYLYKKKSPYSISLKRIKIHYYFDIAVLLYVNFIFAHFPLIYPLVAIGSIVGYLIVFRKKRFHGLLWRFKEEGSATSNATKYSSKLRLDKASPSKKSANTITEVKIPIYNIGRVS